jgi:hypothetical protein
MVRVGRWWIPDHLVLGLLAGGVTATARLARAIEGVGEEGEREREPSLARRIGAKVAAALAATALLATLYGRDERTKRGWALLALVRGMASLGGRAWLRRTPYAPEALFALTTGQVMYSYVMYPASIPPNYYRFILSTGPMHEEVLQAMRRAARGRPQDMAKLREAYVRLGGVANHGPFPLTHDSPAHLPCPILHPDRATCAAATWSTYTRAFRTMIPAYAVVHGLPLALRLRVSRVLPTLLAIAQSTSFLASFVAGCMAVACAMRRPHCREAGYHYWFLAFTAAGVIFTEQPRRRLELGMYVLPRALESIFLNARFAGWLPRRLPLGDELLFGIGVSALVHTTSRRPEELASWVRTTMVALMPPGGEREREGEGEGEGEGGGERETSSSL